YSVVWVSDTDMKSFAGNTAVGFKRVTLVNPGTDQKLVQRIIQKVIEPGNGSGDRGIVGSTYYNIGVASMSIPVEAARLALAKSGAPLTGEQLKAGLEMPKGYAADRLMPPLTLTDAGHQGGGRGRRSDRDGGQWKPPSAWTAAGQ